MFYLNWAALISLMVYTSLEIMRRYGLTPPMRMAVVSEQVSKHDFLESKH